MEGSHYEEVPGVTKEASSSYWSWNPTLFLSSSAVERSAVNRLVVGSNPTWGDLKITVNTPVSFWDVPCLGDVSWGWRKLLAIRTKLSPIRDMLTVRDITRAGLTLSDSVSNVIDNGAWRWPADWFSRGVPGKGCTLIPYSKVFPSGFFLGKGFKGGKLPGSPCFLRAYGWMRDDRWFKFVLKQEFKLEKGLRQGDPLSPLLFILAVEALNVALLEAKNNHSFQGIEFGKDKVYVSHLQFADNALIMGEWSKINVLNLSRLPTCFHLPSRLKVNYFGIGVSEIERNSLVSSIGCQQSNFPCNYLGLPIGANMSRCDNWQPLLERFHKRLSSWKAKTLSFGGLWTPKTVIKKLEGIRQKFFWGGGLDSNMIAWIAWEKVISPFKNGGLDIGSLRVSNLSLLAKWWWCFHCETSSIWATDIKSIHGQRGGLQDISTIRINQIEDRKWRIKKFLEGHLGGKLKIGNGESKSFWKDIWVGSSPLCNAFPRLFRLESHPLCRVCDRVPTVISSTSVPVNQQHTGQLSTLGVSTAISQTSAGIGPTGHKAYFYSLTDHGHKKDLKILYFNVNRSFSQDIASDVIINAGGVSFSLHKFPLVSKCGYIRKLVSDPKDVNVLVVDIPDVPGGSEGFELAAKFCYGINFELSTENIAMVRCVAEYLEMTEDYAIGNLVLFLKRHVPSKGEGKSETHQKCVLRIDVLRRHVNW
ncbi:RNA-directed DNA polymerase, eukaryota, Reverse transcriptase zinc-binding domain protein [Artemisia annua]|uniref:RNA-directed DNA polymerase, eukaryota, Reverse transcriptase zinc-binding domain protein n=1 Tax=Artemisia annua TaxID=35608 RepID=A0A2U1LPM9_ARTAN|nr:RNA-directed DNA polymerase, eukaryota, Reverse transcriptase zinc-binding domain protein [Artemisia annua]